MELSKEQILKRCKEELIFFAEKAYQIIDKSTNKLIRFKLNRIQKYYWDNHSAFDYIIKSRKGGISTFNIARFIHKCNFFQNKRTIMLTQNDDATTKMFRERVMPMVKNSLWPMNVKIKESEGMIEFIDTGSTFYIGTAGSKKFGRGSDITDYHLCLSGETRIVTKDGYIKKINELNDNDTVITHNSKLVKVKSISKIPLSIKGGGLISVSSLGNRAFPIVMTPDHKVISCFGNKKHLSGPEWVESGKLVCKKPYKDGSYVGTPIVSIREDVKEVEMPKCSRKKQGCVPKTRNFATNFDFGWICGLYLAEGTVCKAKRKTGTYSTRVAFSLHEKETYIIDKIKHILSDLGNITIITRPNSKSIIVTLYNSSFAGLIDSLMGGKTNKHIPEQMFGYGKEFMRGLVSGYIDGDGHIHKQDNSVAVSSICPQILIQVRDILLALGYGYGSLSRRDAGVWYGRNCKEIYTLNISGIASFNLKKDLGYMETNIDRERSSHWIIKDGYVWNPVYDIKTAEPEKFVYDIVLDDEDHSFRTISFITHNSEFAHWDDPEVLTAVEEALMDDAEGVIETTANGINFAHQLWKKSSQGNSRYKSIFIPWVLDDTYRIKGISGFNDITSEEKDLIDVFNVDMEQIAWRRKKRKDMSQVELFPQEYPITAEEAFISSSAMVFDWISLMEHEKFCKHPGWQGILQDMGEEIRFKPVSGGSLRIWKMPTLDHTYVIGSDIAEGVKNGCFSTAFILDINEMEQVAEYHGHIPPDEFGDSLFSLGRFYNTALLIPESWPGCGAVTMNKLISSRYPNLWKRDKSDYSHKADSQLYGWETTKRTKPLMIHKMSEGIKDFAFKIRSSALIDECRSFVYDGESMEPQEGCFSDRVMACGIAWFVASKYRADIDPSTKTFRDIYFKSNNGAMMYSPAFKGTLMHRSQI